MIISVSRRCDIPRFQFPWFMERLDAGFVDVPNPFNAAQVRRVSLLPPGAPVCAEVLVFWTRSPGVILEHAENLESRGFRFYVMVSLTGYPPVLEPNAPPRETVIREMGMLAQKITMDRIVWRYDPVFLSDKTDFSFHRRNFTDLAARLKGCVNQVVISVYDEYSGAKRRLGALEKAGFCRPFPHLSAPVDGEGKLLPGLLSLLGDLAESAGAAGMEMRSCAEAEDLSPLGIRAGACIDGELIKKLWGIEVPLKDKNQRPHCRCAPSVDIGRYGSCTAGCVYCYASRN
jgi:hypothetical protein